MADIEYFKDVEINGRTYCVPYNWQVAELIKADYEGYKIRHKSNGCASEIYKVSCFGDAKMIGKLVFNPDTKRLILHKFIKNETHVMQTTEELGINADVFKNLRLCDKIVWHIDKVAYVINVNKAVKVGNYKNFKESYNSELQFFIPVSELKKLEEKTSKKKKCK